MSGKDKFKMIIELDTAELAVRLIEAILSKQRPEGMTAQESLQDFAKTDPDLCESFIVGAKTCIIYFLEQSEKHHLTH